MNFLLSIILFFCIGTANHKVPLQITIDELRSTKGNVSISVFLDQESFVSETPYLSEVFPKVGHIEGDSFTCSIELPEGHYGIVILDDENADERMNYNWVGIPKEGYGFSNFVHKGFTKPDYEDFDFKLDDTIQEMNITLRYF